MKLITIGSSSRGNCHILDSGSSQLMLDCGVKPEKVIGGYNKDTLDGILITHSHGDHCSALKEVSYYLDSKVKVHAAKEVLDVLEIVSTRKVVLEELKPYTITEWQVIPFQVEHDVFNYNYLIKHKPSGAVIAYITDTGYIDNINISNVDYIIIECNHHEEELEQLTKNIPSLAQTNARVLSRTGHLGVIRASAFLRKTVNINTKVIILGHISDRSYVKGKYKGIIAAEFTEQQVVELDPSITAPIHETILRKQLIDFDNL